MLCYNINSSIMTDNEKKNNNVMEGYNVYLMADPYANCRKIDLPKTKSISERYLEYLYHKLKIAKMKEEYYQTKKLQSKLNKMKEEKEDPWNIKQQISRFKVLRHFDGHLKYYRDEFARLDNEEEELKYEEKKVRQHMQKLRERRNKNNNQPNKNIPSIRKKNKVVCK